jgi:hypothetical protein
MVESAELPETLGPAWLLKALILRPTYGLEILLRRFRQIAVFASNGRKTRLFQSLTYSRL